MLKIIIKGWNSVRFWTDLWGFLEISGIQRFVKDLSKIVDVKDLVKIYYTLYEISTSVGPLGEVNSQKCCLWKEDSSY